MQGQSAVRGIGSEETGSEDASMLDIMIRYRVGCRMDKNRYFLVVNLIAGQGKCKGQFPKIKAKLDSWSIDYDLHYTNEPLEATNVARMGIDAGFSHIVAVGGDGTINEVVNGIVGHDVVLGVVPAGSGNDFARMLGIPTDSLASLEVLRDGTERTVDLGYVVEDRYFVNGIGIGIDAKVARDVLGMERLTGTSAYLYAVIREIFRFRSFDVTVKGSSWERKYDCLSLGIANGKYCGGGFKLAPQASLSDGRIDVSVIEDFTTLRRLIRLPQARKGCHLGLREVDYHKEESIIVNSEKSLVAHIDGEPYELRSLPFEVRSEPNALTVIGC